MILGMESIQGNFLGLGISLDEFLGSVFKDLF
jgi:hypothetical protein